MLGYGRTSCGLTRNGRKKGGSKELREEGRVEWKERKENGLGGRELWIEWDEGRKEGRKKKGRQRDRKN